MKKFFFLHFFIHKFNYKNELYCCISIFLCYTTAAHVKTKSVTGRRWEYMYARLTRWDLRRGAKEAIRQLNSTPAPSSYSIYTPPPPIAITWKYLVLARVEYCTPSAKLSAIEISCERLQRCVCVQFNRLARAYIVYYTHMCPLNASRERTRDD